jgi:hypothetical protein
MSDSHSFQTAEKNIAQYSQPIQPRSNDPKPRTDGIPEWPLRWNAVALNQRCEESTAAAETGPGRLPALWCATDLWSARDTVRPAVLNIVHCLPLAPGLPDWAATGNVTWTDGVRKKRENKSEGHSQSMGVEMAIRQTPWWYDWNPKQVVSRTRIPSLSQNCFLFAHLKPAVLGQ